MALYFWFLTTLGAKRGCSLSGCARVVFSQKGGGILERIVHTPDGLKGVVRDLSFPEEVVLLNDGAGECCYEQSPMFNTRT